MANNYYGILTDIGAADFANAVFEGRKVDIPQIVVGDGGGSYYQPASDMTQLRRQVWAGPASVEIDVQNPNVIRIKGIIPSSVGGFTVRELGGLNADGQLIAVANTPDLQKVILSDGAPSDFEIAFEVAVSNSEVVNFTVDPTVIIATKADIKAHAEVDGLHTTRAKQNAWDAHTTDPDLHVTNADKVKWNAAPGPYHNHSGQSGTGMLDEDGNEVDGSGGPISYNYLTDKPQRMTPITHRETHAADGTDPITPASIGAISVDEAAELSTGIAQQNANFIGLALEVAILKGAALSGVNANIYIESFFNLNDITLTNGVYDSAGKRVYLP